MNFSVRMAPRVPICPSWYGIRSIRMSDQRGEERNEKSRSFQMLDFTVRCLVLEESCESHHHSCAWYRWKRVFCCSRAYKIRRIGRIQFQERVVLHIEGENTGVLLHEMVQCQSSQGISDRGRNILLQCSTNHQFGDQWILMNQVTE